MVTAMELSSLTVVAAETTLKNDLGCYFELKEESIGPPSIYLEGRVRKVELTTGIQCLAFSSSQYVNSVVNNVEDYLATQDNWIMPKKVEPLLPTSYRPELDVIPVLNSNQASCYMSLIGVLRWMVELGRVEICLELSEMSSSMAMPREGHIENLFHMFSHLKKYHNTELVLDPSDPDLDYSLFKHKYWTSGEFGHMDGEGRTSSKYASTKKVGVCHECKGRCRPYS